MDVDGFAGPRALRDLIGRMVDGVIVFFSDIADCLFPVLWME